MALELIFDTETSGLYANTLVPLDKQPYIIEFYGCLQEKGEIVNELDLLIKPPVPITAEITKITGITPEMVADKLPFEAHVQEIAVFLVEAECWVAHNCSFDLQMLKFEFERCGIVLPKPKPFCTVEATEHLKGHRLSLTDLHEYLFGEPFKGAHRAKVDVMALKRCYDELIRRGEI